RLVGMAPRDRDQKSRPLRVELAPGKAAPGIEPRLRGRAAEGQAYQPDLLRLRGGSLPGRFAERRDQERGMALALERDFGDAMKGPLRRPALDPGHQGRQHRPDLLVLQGQSEVV